MPQKFGIWERKPHSEGVQRRLSNDAVRPPTRPCSCQITAGCRICLPHARVRGCGSQISFCGSCSCCAGLPTLRAGRVLGGSVDARDWRYTHGAREAARAGRVPCRGLIRIPSIGGQHAFACRGVKNKLPGTWGGTGNAQQHQHQRRRHHNGTAARSKGHGYGEDTGTVLGFG